MGRPGKGYVIDHIDGDVFNCVRSNLQLITLGNNTMKQRRQGAVYRGVREVRYRRQRFRACVGGHGRRLEKSFATLREAALWVDVWRRARGVKGMTYNFPRVGERYPDGMVRKAGKNDGGDTE